jgi:hypothetical protein
MVHLRIADKLLDKLCDLSDTEFIVGNIAPDSGIPNDDWSVFVPSGNVSHFKTTDAEGFKDIHINEYVNQYFSIEKRAQYNKKEKSFYLGYLTHLLTDMLWSDRIVRYSKKRFISLYESDTKEWIWTIKKDWYDLDFLYIRNNPDFRAFSIYKNAIGFRNEYMVFFSIDACDNRREYITSFYSEARDDLEREYQYLNETQMDCFVKESVEEIYQMLMHDYM